MYLFLSLLLLPYGRYRSIYYDLAAIEDFCRPFAWALFAFVASWAVGAITLNIVGKIYSRRTLAMVEKVKANTRTTPEEAQLRAQYAKLIDVAALYYYFTLPAVAGGIVLAAGSLIYFFLWIGFLPTKIMLIAIVGTVIGLGKMLMSLFSTHGERELGRPLKVQEAPELFRLAHEVAQTIGTRPINEIRIVPGSDCCVYEDGDAKQKAKDKTRRVFVFGAALVPGMRLNALRAILAHEYGHFAHRDTAGAEVALKMQQRLQKYLISLYLNGNSENSVPVLMLRGYASMFRRISFGACRLQEILADRVAVACYGPAAFQEGLVHVIRRSLEFDETTHRRLHTATMYHGEAENLYGAHLHNTTVSSPELKEALAEALSRPTTEHDSHPSPTERFRLAARIPFSRQLPPDGMVWDLFNDHGQLFGEMSHMAQNEMYRQVAAQRELANAMSN